MYAKLSKMRIVFGVFHEKIIFLPSIPEQIILLCSRVLGKPRKKQENEKNSNSFFYAVGDTF